MTSASILLVGKPNSGKSLLFNKLTGMKQKVANFPGVTVELKSGNCSGTKIVDFPGVYSLNPITKDEDIAVLKFKSAMESEQVRGVLCVLDATRLERSLMIGLQAQAIAKQEGKSFVYAVNMMDEIIRSRVSVDIGGLSAALGCPVLAISAKTGMGLEELRSVITSLPTSVIKGDDSSTSSIEAGSFLGMETSRKARELAHRFGPRGDLILKTQNRLDDFFLSGWTGGLAFFAVMAFLFQAIFSWAAPVMDAVENALGLMSGLVASVLPEGIVADFVQDALFGGVGSFLVFVPQIFMLTFIIGILEDSGYLARAAIICHRPLSWFGLSGKSFVPLLSGHACSIPAIFAARTIESPKHRLLTWMAIPLMSCSARLPVYGLLISVIVPATGAGVFFGLQGMAFLGLYVFGLMIALLVTSLTSRTIMRKSPSTPFIIELPPYRIPGIRPLILRSLNDALAFIRRAGLVIFTVSVVVWILGYFPLGSGHLNESYLGQMGQWIEPVFKPMGIDWKYGVAILASFVAREVFVGTLGTLFGIEAAEENLQGFAQKIHESGLSVGSALALLVFYVIALQCASTLAVLKKESGSWWLPSALFVGYGLLAYGLGCAVFALAQLF